jgi:hypothetical protein
MFTEILHIVFKDILKEKSSTKSRTSSGGRSIEQTPLIDRLGKTVFEFFFNLLFQISIL